MERGEKSAEKIEEFNSWEPKSIQWNENFKSILASYCFSTTDIQRVILIILHHQKRRRREKRSVEANFSSSSSFKLVFFRFETRKR